MCTTVKQQRLRPPYPRARYVVPPSVLAELVHSTELAAWGSLSELDVVWSSVLYARTGEVLVQWSAGFHVLVDHWILKVKGLLEVRN